MSYPHFDLVEKAELELIAEGKIKHRDNQDEVEQDKGLITKRAAYYVYTERDASHGLMEKTDGNNAGGYSVDWILRVTNGEGWDVTTDTDGMAGAVNGDSHGPNPDYISRWRQPTRELAQLEEETTPPPEPENPQPIPEDLLNYLQEMEDRIIAASDAGDQRTLDRLNSIVDQAEETLKEVLVAYLVLRPEEEPDYPPKALIFKLLQTIRPQEGS